MTDAEYGKKYAVYITPDGVRFLTNEISITIMDMLEKEPLSATNVSDVLNLQNSTVQSNLKKLARWNLVKSHIDENDRRRTIFEPVAVKIIQSRDALPPPPYQQQSDYNTDLQKIIDNFIENAHTKSHYFNTIITTSLKSWAMGIDARPTLKRSGELIAYSSKYQFGDVNLEKSIKSAEKFLNDAKVFPVNTSVEGTDVIMRIDHEFDSDFIRELISMPLIGFMQYAATSSQGTEYCIHSVRHFRNSMEIRFVPCKSKMKNSIGKDLVYMSRHAKSWPVSIYSIDGVSYIFGNQSQMRILEELEKESASLKTLTDTLSIPPVTVHSNLNKLIDDGIVGTIGERSSKYCKYKLNAQLILKNRERDCDIPVRVRESFTHNARFPKNFLMSVFNYINYLTLNAGLDISNIQSYAGKDIAYTIINDHSNDTSDFLELISGTDLGLGAQIIINKYVPLTLELINPNISPEEFEFMIPFFKSMVETGLNISTGDQYNVRMIHNI